MKYMTEAQLILDTERELRSKTKTKTPEQAEDIKMWPMFEQLVAFRVNAAREADLLLTPRQWADHQENRAFKSGDRARFIASGRLETVEGTHGVVEVDRPFGQLGTVTRIHQRPNRPEVITFRPDDPEAPELQTTRWTDLERQSAQ